VRDKLQVGGVVEVTYPYRTGSGESEGERIWIIWSWRKSKERVHLCIVSACMNVEG
jgi:hypothetical protein